ncbi:hypothetical protein BTVI_83835 [Pitangus sulphuratus]|nr:hypothetical protein BTVI_83835 [Pitangus sulphuratus]
MGTGLEGKPYEEGLRLHKELQRNKMAIIRQNAFIPPPLGKRLLEEKRNNLEDNVANSMSEMITANQKPNSCFDIGYPVEES